MRNSLDRNEHWEAPQDLRSIQLSTDGIYLMAILISVVIFSIMVGVYI